MKTKPAKVPAQQPAITFANAAGFARWLTKNHADHPGIWLKIAKKGAGRPSVTYVEALDVALCHGWIDGQKRGNDETSWLQKFIRRGPRSMWSQNNVRHVARLVRAGRMQPAGLAAVAAAKADGRWERAYAAVKTMVLPDDFMAALKKSPKAGAGFKTLNKANRYAIYHRLHSAKRPETRARRLSGFIAMLERGEKLH